MDEIKVIVSTDPALPRPWQPGWGVNADYEARIVKPLLDAHDMHDRAPHRHVFRGPAWAKIPPGAEEYREDDIPDDVVEMIAREENCSLVRARYLLRAWMGRPAMYAYYAPLRIQSPKLAAQELDSAIDKRLQEKYGFGREATQNLLVRADIRGGFQVWAGGTKRGKYIGCWPDYEDARRFGLSRLKKLREMVKDDYMQALPDWPPDTPVNFGAGTLENPWGVSETVTLFRGGAEGRAVAHEMYDGETWVLIADYDEAQDQASREAVKARQRERYHENWLDFSGSLEIVLEEAPALLDSKGSFRRLPFEDEELGTARVFGPTKFDKDKNILICVHVGEGENERSVWIPARRALNGLKRAGYDLTKKGKKKSLGSGAGQ